METQVLKVDSNSDFSAEVAQAVACVDDGGLVAFPTETVYGLGVRADLTDSLERLATLKERPDEKPFTLHIGEKSAVDRFVPGLSLLDRQFLKKAWPGPLTVVFQLSESQVEVVKSSISEELYQNLYWNNTIGIRLPDHPVGRAFLAGAGGPIVAPSANLAGQVPPSCGDDVLEQLDGQFDMLLDAGRTRYNKASTVISLNEGGMTILREGILDKGTLERMRKLTILVVCTGNTCRSPMAEGIFKQRIAKKLGCHMADLADRGYVIHSAGAMTMGGMPVSIESVQACNELGIDISSHRSNVLTVDMINQADYIFVMDTSHHAAVQRLSTNAIGKLHLMGVNEVVSDPVGMSLAVYRQCCEQIKQGVDYYLENELSEW